MIRNTLMGLALCAGLSACGPAPTADSAKQAVVNVRALDLNGKAIRCLGKHDINITTTSTELKGDLRRRFLTPDADAAGIRVYVGSSSVTDYGSQTIVYVNGDDSCVVFAEGISVQEYGQRLGLSPLGVSPFYEPDVKKVEPTKSVSPTVEPVPVKSDTK